MEEKDIIKIWKIGYDKLYNDKPITMETIENLVKLRSGKVAGKIRWDLYFSLGCNILGLALTIYASILYKSHIYLSWILPVLASVVFLLFIHNLILIGEQKKLKLLNVSLRERVSGIIRYFKGGYRLWQTVYPIGIIILVFSVTLLIDYQDGIYRINKPFTFIATLVMMYILMYFPMRYARNVYLQDLENCLLNLDEQEYLSIEKIIRRHRVFMIIFVVGLVLLVLGGLVMWYIYSTGTGR